MTPCKRVYYGIQCDRLCCKAQTTNHADKCAQIDECPQTDRAPAGLFGGEHPDVKASWKGCVSHGRFFCIACRWAAGHPMDTTKPADP